jgi:hypothetical protein
MDLVSKNDDKIPPLKNTGLVLIFHHLWSISIIIFVSMSQEERVQTIQSALTDEVFFALGLNRRGFLRRSLGWVFAWPTKIFAKHLVEADQAVAVSGAPAGCRKVLDLLGVQPEVMGLSNIPNDGPTIMLCNHPGAYDSMAIGSQIPRMDLKAIVSLTRLYQSLPHIHPVLIYVEEDTGNQMMVLKSAIAHLQSGGSLLQFGSGLIEPDPATYPLKDEVFKKWSSSLEIFLRKVPETRVVPTVASGVLLARFMHHLLVRLRREAMDQRRLAEFLQIIQQLLLPITVTAKPHISFGKPFMLSDLDGKQNRRIMPEVITRVKTQLTEHLEWISSKADQSVGK